MARTDISSRTDGPDIENFEAQAAQTVGEMKALFREFENRLGEVVSAHRLATSESRNEAAKARAALEELTRQANALVDGQRRALDEVRQGWRLYVAENSREAGEEIARAFGAQIANGLKQQLQGMCGAVERATVRFGWATALKWTAGIAIGIVLTIALGVWALLPGVDGIPWPYLRAAASRLQPCEFDHMMHVCVAVDDKSGIRKSAGGEPLVVVRGM